MTRGLQWLEIILGLLLGLSLGLAITWWIAPNTRMDLSLAALRSEYKDEVRLQIALAYVATSDLGRAETRLALLGDADGYQALIDQVLRLRSGQTQSSLSPGDTEQAVYTLALLAYAIQPTGSSQEQLPTLTIAPTRGLPTATYLPFALYSQETVCNGNTVTSLTRIQVQDASGQPLPGVEIVVTWDGGQENIFTGLKPEQGDGYADFIMAPGVLYTLQLLPSSAPLTGLAAPECTAEDGSTYQGGLLLVFEQP
jgi:hypothetical protein